MLCIEKLAKIIWINFIISTRIEKKCLIKAVMKFLGWNCSATTAKVENYSEKKIQLYTISPPTLRAKIKVKIHQGCARLHCILILTFPWSSVHYWGPWQESGSTVQQQWSVVANSKNPPKLVWKNREIDWSDLWLQLNVKHTLWPETEVLWICWILLGKTCENTSS